MENTSTKATTKQIITSEDVHLYYGDFEALHGIDLDFGEHEITALIGPSGCGKSTYLRCLNRMNDLIPGVKITGSMKLEDQDIYAPKVDVVDLRKRVGMVFQQPNPFPFSVYENVAYGLRLAGVHDKSILDERVETSLKQAAIWDEVKDNLYDNALSFSGGQQQRICVARVLAVQPEVVLLDEPTSALDPISSAKIEDTLLNIHDKYTVIIVTHNMQQASRISDRTAFLLNGNLVEYDKTEKLFMNPEKEETSDYLNGKFG
ncbi:phosphate ABC transporter ATP-binding protein [Lentilactobacillus parafarraginis]|jgi:phosphate transport system ATP-binding protein|uniref:Phosphate ABC transporter, ATP-binding protein n=2 Tax=Lentilactobacillus parafarraginis TaxID=390842 RepID=A0A0R1YLA7_9LACO|nr:phosphate ABC transporter ATP-binding protein PstB [Lentilactobacillus parafarraginis]KRM43264.1 phosphate ABC transporter, ATP-binding protein [Lentilactobacillus parafarraginis DSM 18390 = JCM 14109]TLQ19345.1 phosphate ABC transporter ATP-binding protein [Lentilactobacillus parafarraginis]